MKKTITVFIIISIILTLTMSATFAAGSPFTNSSNPLQGNKTSPVVTNSSSSNNPMSQAQAQFEDKKLGVDALKVQTDSKLIQQFQNASKYKAELQTKKQTFDAMSDEERDANNEEIKSMFQQIRETHRYTLQVLTATKEQPRNLMSYVKQNGVPTEEEVEEVLDITNEL